MTAFSSPATFGTRAFRTSIRPNFRPCIHPKSPTRSHSSFHAPAMTSAKLLTPQWLSAQIDSGQSDELTILDVRGRVQKTGGRVSSGFQPVEYVSDDGAYFAGHVPGAGFVDWRKIDVTRHVELCDMLSQLGVEREKPVCVYDWGDMLFATRLWFALGAVGCKDVGVLSAGWKGWDVHDGPVSLETMCPLKSYSELETTLEEHEVPGQSVALAEMRAIVRQVESGAEGVVIVDARSKRQYTGEERRALRAGHLPGAVNVPYRTMLNEDGISFREDEELRAVFQGQGLLEDAMSSSSSSSGKDYVVYCNGGVSSTVVMFGLARCGVPLERIRNYCGSFNEWGNLEDTPLLVNT